MLRGIIFAENHNNAKSRKFMRELIPELNIRGYTIFYDETLPKDTIEDLKKQVIEECDQYEKDYFRQKSSHPEEEIASCVEAYIEGNFTENVNDPLLPKSSWDYGYVYHTLRSYSEWSSAKEHLKFYTALQENNIQYRGIDNEDGLRNNIKWIYDPSMGEEKTDIRRDTDMANAYLSHDLSPGLGVFGRVGFAHVKPIQEIILQQLPLERAKQEFCFIHLYSYVPDCAFRKRVDQEYSHFHEEVQCGETTLPLGINLINIDEHNALEHILSIIDKKISSSQKPTAINKEVLPIYSSNNFSGFFTLQNSSESNIGIKSSPSKQQIYRPE